MNAITVLGTSYDFPQIKDGRFDELQERIRKSRDLITQSEKPKGLKGLIIRRPQMSAEARLDEMEGLVANYDELIRVLKSKIDACREVFTKIGDGVEAEFSKRLAELERMEVQRSALAGEMARMGKADAADAMDAGRDRIRSLAMDLTRASILIVRKLRHALDALETLAQDDDAQRLVYDQLRGDVALYRKVYEFNRDLSRLEQEIAEMTKLALSFDGILRDNLGPLSILIDEIGKVDARLGESLLEIERLSAELEGGRTAAIGREILSDALISQLLTTRIKADVVESIVAAIADPASDQAVIDLDVETVSSAVEPLDFKALASNMAALVAHGLDALHGRASANESPQQISAPDIVPQAADPVLATPQPVAPEPLVTALPSNETPKVEAAPAPEAKPSPSWTPPPPRAEPRPAIWAGKAPYTAAISRASPTLILFLLDRSGSMDAPYSDGRSCAQYLARVVDSAIAELAVRCNKADGIRDYFHIAALGYGNGTVASAFGGSLAGLDWLPVSRIAATPSSIEREPGSAPRPRWVEAIAEGDTPMRAAMERACHLAADWCGRYPESYPPTVINITDGEPTDGSPEAAASVLRQIHTDDGEVLLFNLHVAPGGASELVFPHSEAGLGENGRLLFRMSSTFPPHLRERAGSAGFCPSTNARFFAYGAGAELATRFLDLGTRPAKLV